MARFHLRTLGGLSLVRTASPTVLAENRRKPLALLALLAGAADLGMTREKLAGYLWTESDTDRARGGLKQTLYVLRKELDAEDLFLGLTDLRLNPEAIGCDLWDLEDRARQGDEAGAVSCYRGPFLDGVHLADSPEFGRWVEEQRARLAHRVSGLLERLAITCLGRNDNRGAAERWLRLTEHDPFDTRAVTGLLHALLGSGDRPQALIYAERHMALLRKELDLTPDPELRRLVDQVRARPSKDGPAPA